MERSLNSSGGREKYLPALLIVVGLLCASWLSIQADPDNKSKKHTSADTTIRKKSGKPVRTKIYSYSDDNGTVHEEITEDVSEDFEGGDYVAVWGVDEPVPAIEPIAEIREPFDAIFPAEVWAVEPAPVIEPISEIREPLDAIFPAEVWAVDPIEMIPSIAAMPPFASQPFTFGRDTVPGHYFWKKRDWEQFNSEFEEKFRERFEDFYKKHEKDLSKMLRELEEKFDTSGKGFEELYAALDAINSIDRDIAPHLEEMEEAMREQREALWEREWQLKEQSDRARSKVPADQRDANFEKRMLEMEAQAEAMERRARDMQHRADDAAIWNGQFEADMKLLEKEMKGFEENMKKFEGAVEEQLVKDGYLKKGEKIDHMSWDDDGDIEFNGIKIKEKDIPKYREIHRKYMNDEPHIRKRVE